MHLNSKGYTKVEPGDEFIRSEEPSMLTEAIEMLDDVTWVNILMKTGLSQELVRELFSVSRPLSNPKKSTSTGLTQKFGIDPLQAGFSV